MRVSFVWIYLCAFAGVTLTAAQCPYQTLVGRPGTFAGENVPVGESVFHQPTAIVVSVDGSIYVTDTGNNRVRRIGTDGVIRTVAGTGERGFSGDGGPATQAALNQPSGIAVGSDSTVYVADTQNHRVRAISPSGSIRTVAGDGRPAFRGDGGAATAASLNLPTSIAVDSAGRLLIVDSYNNRVRRVEADGRIATVAGYLATDDYVNNLPCCDGPSAKPAAEVALINPASVTTGRNGEVLITDSRAIWSLGQDGILRPFVIFDGGAPFQFTGPVALADLRIASGTPAVLTDGSIAILSGYDLLRVAGGSVSTTAKSIFVRSIAADPATGGTVTLGVTSPNYSYFGLGPGDPPWQILRQRADGTTVNVYTADFRRDPATASPLSLNLYLSGAVAAGPDGTIYLGDGAPPSGGRILAISKDGAVRVTALTTGLPRTIAVDGKGAIFYTQGATSQVMKVIAGGASQMVYSIITPLAMGFDAQDRLYVLSADRQNPISRFDVDGTKTVIYTQGSFDLFSGQLEANRQRSMPYPMAVAPDGSVYVTIVARFSNTISQILKVTPQGMAPLIDVEQRVYPQALAVSAAGDLYMAYNGVLQKVLPDGTFITLYGGDKGGFHGERGFDSAFDSGPNWLGLASDGAGGLLVVDSGAGALRRVALTGCNAVPTPAVGGTAESATGNTGLKLAPGQLFSIYGKRLGPAGGAVSQFDSTGHVPLDSAGVRVTVNGVTSRLLYVSDTQINAIVPFALEGQGPAGVQVSVNGMLSDIDYSRSIGYYGPAIFNYSSSATGSSQQYAVMLNEDGTLNTSTNPAKAGSVVTLYATGTGATDAPGEDGKRAEGPLKYSRLPVEITVSGQKATVLYAGVAPFLVEGTTQINFRLPSPFPVGGNIADVAITMGLGVSTFSMPRLFFYFKP